MGDLNKSDIIARIKGVAKEKGYSLNFIYKQLCLPSGYLRDVNAGKSALTEERICAIADFLGTTSGYLKGESDIKEKATTVSGDDLSEAKQAMINWVINAPDSEIEALYNFLQRNATQAGDSQ